MPDAYWTHTLQGARPYNEDRVTACPPHFFAMHDGHGGKEAANLLAAYMHGRFSGPPLQARDHAFALADAYTQAQQRLAQHRSGVVSVSALLGPDGLHFAVVGDCQACAFACGAAAEPLGDVSTEDEDGPPAASPTTWPLLTAPLATYDVLPDEGGRLHDRLAPLQLPLADGASQAPVFTAAHALQPDVTGWYTTRTHLGGGEVIYGTPKGFHDAMSQREWVLASRLLVAADKVPAHMREPPYDEADLQGHPAPPPPPPHLMPIEIAVLSFGLYARFLASVEPTRSLGDHPTPVMSHPEIYAVHHKAPKRHRDFVLLCTDGFFDGEAYAGIHAVAALLADPVLFARRHLYHPKQHLTQRLIHAGHLPPDLQPPHDPRQYPLYAQWQGCDAWDQLLPLLSAHRTFALALQHLPEAWVTAASKSLDCLSNNWPAYTKPPSMRTAPEFLVHLAVHLAVIMGSHDNVTLLVAPLLPHEA